MTTTRSRTAHRNRTSADLHERIDRQVQEAKAIGREYPHQAIQLCLETRTLLQGTIHRDGEIQNELVLATALIHAARSQESLEILHELLPNCIDYGETVYTAECYYLFGMVYNDLSNFSEALINTEEALQLYLDSNLISGRAKAELLLGSIYMTIGMYDRALEQSLTALELFQTSGHIEGVALAYNNIGSAYNEQKDNPRAIEFYQKSIEIKRELGDSLGVANTLNNTAHIFFWANQEYERALEYYGEALEISKKHGYPSHAAAALQHMGQVYVYLEKFDEAVRFSEDGLAITERTGSEYTLAYALMDLGFVYYHVGRIEECIDVIKRGLEIAERIRATSHMSKGYNLLRQIYTTIGDFENATKFSEKTIELQQRIFNDASDRRAQRLMVQYEVEKTRQEKELYRLRTESLRQETEHKSKELATMAMYLMQKNEFLSKMAREIEKVGAIADPAAAALLESLQEQIRETIGSERVWENFEQQFKLVHHDFISRLSERYPVLTPMELKVAALMRMDLSTKEIASLLYQSPRSIESYRYRLRRKMEVSSDVNLGTHLHSI